MPMVAADFYHQRGGGNILALLAAPTELLGKRDAMRVVTFRTTADLASGTLRAACLPRLFVLTGLSSDARSLCPLLRRYWRRPNDGHIGCRSRWFAHDRPRPIATTSPLAAGLAQNSAQASMSLRRFSNRSPRRYAFSTADGIACAKAISQTSR
jgi:hypothetical protein